jgi:hypothetical protein
MDEYGHVVLYAAQPVPHQYNLCDTPDPQTYTQLYQAEINQRIRPLKQVSWPRIKRHDNKQTNFFLQACHGFRASPRKDERYFFLNTGLILLNVYQDEWIMPQLIITTGFQTRKT